MHDSMEGHIQEGVGGIKGKSLTTLGLFLVAWSQQYFSMWQFAPVSIRKTENNHSRNGQQIEMRNFEGGTF